MTEVLKDTLVSTTDNKSSTGASSCNTGAFNRSPQTPASPLLQWLPSVVLLALISIGSVQILSTGVLTLAAKEARAFSNRQNVLTGQWAHRYEQGLDAGLPFRDSAIQLWATAAYQLFGEARPGIVVGEGGWLYTAEEFQTSVRDAEEIAKKLEYIRQVRAELSDQGTALLVALVPAKARVYPEHLGPGVLGAGVLGGGPLGQRVSVPAVKANVYQSFRAQVQALGIPAPDLLADLQAAKPGGNVFIRTDTHWSPRGARVAAEAVARMVQQWRPPLDLPAAEFLTTAATTPSNLGDLLSYLPLPRGLGPKAEQVHLPTTVQVGGGGTDLLGAAPIAVTLVGTSYSAVKDWNFEGALKQALGTDVLNVSSQGEGPIIPMQAYLNSPALRETPPQLVIWEIPERFLRLPYLAGNTQESKK
jgi:alginate O-acetyltransferase complex protein AlgJ